MAQNKKSTGRPSLSKSGTTVRVGFSITDNLWAKFVKKAKKDGVSYSALFRALVENMQEV